MPGGTRALTVSAGDTHTCATLTNGRLACWGTGSSGQIGSMTGMPNGLHQGDFQYPFEADSVGFHPWQCILLHQPRGTLRVRRDSTSTPPLTNLWARCHTPSATTTTLVPRIAVTNSTSDFLTRSSHNRCKYTATTEHGTLKPHDRPERHATLMVVLQGC